MKAVPIQDAFLCSLKYTQQAWLHGIFYIDTHQRCCIYVHLFMTQLEIHDIYAGLHSITTEQQKLLVFLSSEIQ
jgi:hypothetical protein